MEETVHHPFAIGHYYKEPDTSTAINLFRSLLSINPKQNYICYTTPKEHLSRNRKFFKRTSFSKKKNTGNNNKIIEDFAAETLP